MKPEYLEKLRNYGVDSVMITYDYSVKKAEAGSFVVTAFVRGFSFTTHDETEEKAMEALFEKLEG